MRSWTKRAGRRPVRPGVYAGLALAVAASIGTGLAAPVGAATSAAQSLVSPVMTASPNPLAFGPTAIGVGATLSTTITNNGNATEDLSGISVGGTDAADVLALATCPAANVDQNTFTAHLPPGTSCTVTAGFSPSALGARSATITLHDDEATPLSIPVTGTGTEGYDEVTGGGIVSPFGNARSFGDLTGHALNAPIVDMAVTSTGNGYWLLGGDGGIFTFGDAQFAGSTGGLRLNKPVIGLAPTLDDGGYLLVAADGGIFAFGDGQFFGSTGDLVLNRPIVAMAMTPDGGGYWEVASDGGVFAFGDAGFFGSTGNLTLNQPIVAMVPTLDGNGYWLIAADGGVFAFGDAAFHGGTGNLHLARPIVSGVGTPTGGGYWFAGSDGGVFSFGDAPFYGSTAGRGTPDVVAMAPTGSVSETFFFEQAAGFLQQFPGAFPTVFPDSFAAPREHGLRSFLHGLMSR